MIIIKYNKKKSYDTSYFIDLLLEMTTKELKVRYKNTIFGFLWIIVNPLLQMMVIGFIFKFLIKDPVPNYYLYLLVGLLVWNFFSMSLNKVTPSIVNERSLIKKARFPREIIPLSIILSNFVNLMIAVLLLIVPVVYSGLLSIYNFPSIILAIILLLLFTVGLGLLTSALNVKYRDVSFFISAMLILWFYATPVVYSISMIPHNLIWLWRLNPMTIVVQLFQNGFLSAPKPGIGMFLSNTVIIIVISFLGNWVFKKESKEFDDWV